MADYPITAVPRRVVYSGSAGTGPYSFSFPVIAQTDIDVYLNTTKLTLTTNYTVAITASNGTGVVTLGVAAGSSDFITIVGARAIQRTTDFVTAGDLLASSLNVELDSQTIFVQQASEDADRAIKAPVTDPTSIDMTLPVKATRATKALGFDAAGDPVVSTLTLAQIEAGSTDAAAAAAAAVVSANAAAASAASAATSYDNFDDRYLGQKSSDPSVDNDGGSLITGALYFNSSNNVMMVYTGSAWVRTTPTSTDQTTINAVNANASNINTVAGVASNVTTVAGISANVTSVAGIAANTTTVAGIAANVTTTAGISSDVTTVAGIAGDVTAVAAQVVGYDFSTTTAMADPGSGNVRFNNATLSSVSQIAIDDVDKNGVNQSAFIILWDDSTNTVKGTLVFRTAGGDVATFLITGLTDNAGWSQIAVTHVASSGTFSNGEDTFIGFTRAGDKGADGEGSGDVVGPASATDNTAVRFNSTTGKLIQASGVTIDDSNNVGAASLTLTTDLAVAHGGTGGSTASAARSNLGAAALGSNSDITALTGLTTDLSVAQGGTGASTHTAASVLVGAGTSAITSVAPSTSGNLLTSTGSAWTSAAPAGGGSMVLLLSGTVSSASSLAIEGSSYINDTYVRYVLHYEQTASVTATPRVTFRQQSTGSYLSSLYYSAQTGVGGSGSAQSSSYYNTSYVESGFTFFHVNHPGNIEMTFHSLRASDCFSSLAFHGGYPEDYYSDTAVTYGIGGVRNTAVVDGMKWTPSAGSFTGRYWWYGLKGS
jgi:hypothetical protein